MEILIYENDLLYQIDGLDPDSEQVSLVEVQPHYDGKAVISELVPIGNLELVSPDKIQTALGEALGRNCPELQEHRKYYAGFPRIQICTDQFSREIFLATLAINAQEGAENAP